jgi:hypothetical protein
MLIILPGHTSVSVLDRPSSTLWGEGIKNYAPPLSGQYGEDSRRKKETKVGGPLKNVNKFVYTLQFF